MEQKAKTESAWDLPLIDRLLDEQRWIIRVEVRAATAALQRLQLSVEELAETFEGHGLLPLKDELSHRGIGGLAASMQGDSASDPTADVVLDYVLPPAAPRPFKLKEIVIKPPGAAQEGVALKSFCSFGWRSELNKDRHVGGQRAAADTRFLGSLRRDVETLLNTTSPALTNLAHCKEVQRSVINYGIPAVAGAIDDKHRVLWIAAEMRRALESFEPRLRSVRVIPEFSRPYDEARRFLKFRIEARLWNNARGVMLSSRFNYASSRLEIEEARET